MSLILSTARRFLYVVYILLTFCLSYVHAQNDLLRHLLTEPKVALFHGIDTIMSNSSLRCKMTVAYMAADPDHLSFAFPKGSPYREAFQYQLIKLFQSGLLKVRTLRS